MQHRRFLVLAAALVTGACSDRDLTDPTATSSVLPAYSTETEPGAVFVMTNGSANAILLFERRADGTLGGSTSFATGGAGTGAGLGSQGALAFSADGRYLLAVNAGSDELTAFRVIHRRLERTARVASGGDMPISVTVHGSVVYVVNAGGTGNISGFTLSPHGTLTPIAGSSRPLSGSGTGPAQIEFSPDGNTLVVTEKATNRILTYAVNAQGLASGPTVHVSAGMTPFGFAFAGRDLLIVSEAFGGAPDASAVSSYHLEGSDPDVVSASVPTTETAACWTAVTRNGRFAYVTNTGSGSITGYAIGRSGTIERLNGNGVTGSTGTGSSPLDAAFSSSSQHLYTLNGNGTISAFAVAANGALTPIAGAAGLPAGAAGIVAH